MDQVRRPVKNFRHFYIKSDKLYPSDRENFHGLLEGWIPSRN